MVYASDEEWRETNIYDIIDSETENALERRIRMFHGFSVAVSSAQIPLAVIDPFVDSVGMCDLRKVIDVTKISADESFILFSVGVGVSVLVILLALVCRLMYRGEAWHVGSIQWMVGKLVEEILREIQGNGTVEMSRTKLVVMVEKERIEEEGPADTGRSSEPIESGVENGASKEKRRADEHLHYRLTVEPSTNK